MTRELFEIWSFPVCLCSVYPSFSIFPSSYYFFLHPSLTPPSLFSYLLCVYVTGTLIWHSTHVEGRGQPCLSVFTFHFVWGTVSCCSAIAHELWETLPFSSGSWLCLPAHNEWAGIMGTCSHTQPFVCSGIWTLVLICSLYSLGLLQTLAFTELKSLAETAFVRLSFVAGSH